MYMGMKLFRLKHTKLSFNYSKSDYQRIVKWWFSSFARCWLAGCLAGMYVCVYYCYFFLNLGYRSSSMYNRHTTGYGCCCCCCWWLLFPSICSLFFHIFLCISNRIDERKFTFGRFTNDLMEFSLYKHVFPFMAMCYRVQFDYRIWILWWAMMMIEILGKWINLNRGTTISNR